MIKKLISILKHPVFTDNDLTFRAKILNISIYVFMAALTTALLLSNTELKFQKDIIFVYAAFLIIFLAVKIILNIGRVNEAALIFTVVIWLRAVFSIFGITNIGIYETVTIKFYISLLFAGFLLRKRPFLILTGITASIWIIIYGHKFAGIQLPVSEQVYIHDIVSNLFILLFMTFFINEFHKRKDVEKNLINSRNIFHSVLENIPMSVFWQAKDGRLLGCNSNFSILTGANDPEELIGKESVKCPNYLGLDEYLDNSKFSETKESSQIHTIAKTIDRSDGKNTWFEVNLVPTEEGSGNNIGLIGTVRDVSERIKTEDELRIYEERLRTVISNMPVLLLSVDEEGVFILNEGKGLQNLEIQRNELVGESAYKYFSDYPQIISSIKLALSGRSIIKEIEINGRFYASIYSPLFDEIGHIYGVNIAAADITRRVVAEELLKRREREYRERLESMVDTRTRELHIKERELEALLNNLPDLAWFKDPDLNYVLANKPFADSCGLPQNEIKGKNDLDLWPKNLADKYRDDDKFVLNTGKTLRLEEPFTTVDGSKITIETIKNPIRDKKGDSIGIVGIGRDITERKKNEEELKKFQDHLEEMVRQQTEALEKSNVNLLREIAEKEEVEKNLRESEEGYRNLFESANDPIIIFEPENEIVLEANSKALEVYGFTRSEFIGMSLGTLSKDAEKGKERIKRLLSGETSLNFETVNYTREGTSLEFISNASVIDYKGKKAIMTINRNVTERNILIERINRAQKMDSIGKMAGAVAHDLNHILSGLVTYPDIILMDLEQSDPLRKKIAQIKKSGLRAAGIVEDLLSMSRGRYEEYGPVDANKVIRECIESPGFKESLSSNPIVIFSTFLESPLQMMEGSEVQLLKIFYNLLNNAIEAMPHGGDLRLRTQNITITETIIGFDEIPPGEYIRITVADSGIGLSKNDMKQIFEPYYSKKKSTKSGTGIGLTIVWNLVKEQEGFFELRSELGIGTDFIIYFPVMKLDEEKTEQSPPVKEEISVQISILIVDDEESQREIATKTLEKIGFNAFSMPSGEKAIEYLKENDVDIVLMDMFMEKGKSGLDTYKEIITFKPDQKVIIVSGYLSGEVLDMSKEAGIQSFIKKPYTVEEMKTKIIEEFLRPI